MIIDRDTYGKQPLARQAQNGQGILTSRRIRRLINADEPMTELEHVVTIEQHVSQVQLQEILA